MSLTGAGSASVGQSTSRSPPSTTPADSDRLFLAVAEVGDALGLEVEALGIRTDTGQWWESIDIDPAAVLATRVQTCRWPSTDDGDAFPGMVDVIDHFGSPSDGASYGAEAKHDVLIVAGLAATDHGARCLVAAASNSRPN